MDLNEVSLIGRITSEIELKTTPNDKKVVNFSVATNERYTDANSGEVKDVATFHNIVIWGKLAEIIDEYGSKGAKVFVRGKLQTRSWTDPNTEEKRYKTEILASNIILLDNRSKNEEENDSFGVDEVQTKKPASKPTPAVAPKKKAVPRKEEEINIEDIPFR